MRCAIYARVSTTDKGQDTENQLLQLRRYCDAAGWSSVEFIDHETGKHSNRAGFLKLFEGASRKEFDVVLVWALDRFTREGISETFAHIEKLTRYGCKFESLTEPQFRTTNGPAAELMLAIAAWIAKQERIRISERTKAGLATARRAGRCGGRPTNIFRRDQAQEMRDAGVSWRQIAFRLEVPESTIRRVLKTRATNPAKQVRQKRIGSVPVPAK